jgi:hypothetical protein
MKIKILMMMIVLCTAGNLLAGNLLVNPGFESGNTGWFGTGTQAGDHNTPTTIPGWVFWGTDGWVHSNTGMYLDTRAILIWSDAPGIFQDIDVTEDTEYNFSAALFSPSSDNHGLHGWDGVIQVEWRDADGFMIYSEEIGRFYGALNIDQPVDAYNTWKVVSAKFTAPVPAAHARIFIHLVANDGSANGSGGIVSWDNIFAGTGPSCPLGYFKGDTNNDCSVNFADFAQMAENWLKCNDVFNANCQ